MKILLIGSGGREHALAWKMMQSHLCKELHVIPGSDAMADEGAQCHADINVLHHDEIVAFCQKNEIAFVMIGPEAPLVAGLADDLRAEGIAVFGPSKEAAKLEGSKAFMKDLCMKYGVPTASYGRFTNAGEAKNFIQQKGLPIVIKADGLAAGKGVIIAQTKDEAEKAIDDMLDGALFGDSGAEIVVEEYLEGEEVSVFALCDGKDILMFASAQDHKAAYDGDQGPNTGGMGAYSPAHMMTEELENQIRKTMIEPTVQGMAREGRPFQGVLFAGIMLTRRADGSIHPKLLEYNVRFGDPECQVLMARLQNDLVEILHACAIGQLEEDVLRHPLKWDERPALCVVMAAEGYPGSYEKGTRIKLPKADDLPADSKIIHAGTIKDPQEENVWHNNGGRVLGCVALGDDFAAAQSAAYDLVTRVDWPDGFCRTDIGHNAVQ